MNEKQYQFLSEIGRKISRLLELMREGHSLAYFRLGSRQINGKEVVLKLVVEVVVAESSDTASSNLNTLV